MQSKNILHVIALTSLMHFGVFAGLAQTGQDLFTGSETTITLNPGLYKITAYGAQGGFGRLGVGGLGAEMSGEFYFSAGTTLTLLVGGVGAAPANAGNATDGGGAAAGGGGGSFVIDGSTPLVVAGGGGGAGYLFNGGSGSTGTSGQVGGFGGGGGGTSGSGGGSGGGGNGGGGYFSSGGTGPFGGTGGGSFLRGGVAGGGGSGGNLNGARSGGNGGYGGGGGGTGAAGGGGGGYSGGGGGGNGDSGGSEGTGGGGGSIIDSSATMVLAEVSGVASPNGSPNGEIIITAVPEPTSLALAAMSVMPVLLFRRQRERSKWPVPLEQDLF